MNDRKKDHIELALQARVSASEKDERFIYEPALSGHPAEDLVPFKFLGKTMKVPMWASSMTGGTEKAGVINKRLAKACKKYGMGMGLGSCRQILFDRSHWADFDLRDIIGDDLPFYANIGVAQVEELLEKDNIDPLIKLVQDLRTDGLIVHINPFQELFQPEGDRYKNPPVQTIKQLLKEVKFPVIVKEVGQGMGPESIKELMRLKLAAIEFGALGGTNFSKLELLRNPDLESHYKGFPLMGHTAEEMIKYVNTALSNYKHYCKEVIISGGVSDFLEGYYLNSICQANSVYGHAYTLLKYAEESYEALDEFLAIQVKGYRMAESFLVLKELGHRRF